MKPEVKKFIISQLPKVYRRIHQVVDIVGIENNTIITKIKYNDMIIDDRVSSLGIVSKVRDYKLETLLK